MNKKLYPCGKWKFIYPTESNMERFIRNVSRFDLKTASRFIICVDVKCPRDIYIPFLIIIIAELNRAPFDFSEGERELVRGYNVEFASVAFVLLFLSEYGSLIFFSVLSSVIFFDFSIFASFLIFSILIFIRSSYPRYRYDLMMSLF
jgi:hypothetical protein